MNPTAHRFVLVGGVLHDPERMGHMLHALARTSLAIRRLAIPIEPDTVVNVDAAQLDLVAPGDVVLVEGRVWRGEGCLGDGTVFASAATVTKADAVPAARQARESVPEIGVAGPTGRGGF